MNVLWTCYGRVCFPCPRSDGQRSEHQSRDGGEEDGQQGPRLETRAGASFHTQRRHPSLNLRRHRGVVYGVNTFLIGAERLKNSRYEARDERGGVNIDVDGLASGSTPAGQGMMNFTTRPTAMESRAGTILAPFHTKPPPPLAGGSEAAASPAAATTAPPPLVALATTEGDVERGEKGTRLLLLPAAPVDVRRATPRNAPGRLADWPRG